MTARFGQRLQGLPGACNHRGGSVDFGMHGKPLIDTADAAPLVSVVMAVYREFRFLDAAVGSILAQDFAQFELIIVDDGNQCDALFAALLARDPRVRLVSHPVNRGHATALNSGIAAARSDLIARMDQDDIAAPSRLGQQYQRFAQDPGLGLLGSDVQLMDMDGVPGRVQIMPHSDLAVRWIILFHCPFYHPTVMFRRALYEAAGGYRAALATSEDHYLWFDMLPHGRMANIDAPLLQYRLNPTGMTAVHNTNPRGRTHAIRAQLWADIGLTYDLYDDALAGVISRFLRGHPIPVPHRPAAHAVLNRVLDAFLAAAPARKDAATIAQGESLAANLRGRMTLG